MKLGVLFSGGKDSCFACYLAKKYGYDISCLIAIVSENPYSYMFHTPLIEATKKQAEAMNIPLIKQNTKGKKEIELIDLKKAIKTAKEKYSIEGIVTGAVESVYQSTRIQKICDKLGIECFNPLWQKDQIELLNDLIKYRFEVIISGVFAFPLDKRWIGRKIDSQFIKDIQKLKDQLQVNPAGEGGEFETFVLDSPLFTKPLQIKESKIMGKDYSWRMTDYDFVD
jgi:diphthine-ammonia ligase